MNFTYHLYGLTISSSRQITVLNPVSNTLPDLHVNWATISHGVHTDEPEWQPVLTKELEFRKQITFFSAPSVEGTSYKICFATEYGGLYFTLNPDQNLLQIFHHHTEPISDLESYFVGSIIGCVLRLRGKLCLHSSVINLHGRAVLFLGSKRSGKSTTAAAFAQMGVKVLSDDIAAITFKNGVAYAEPGYAKIRLREQSLAALHEGTSAENFPAVYTTRCSRYTDIKEVFQAVPLPVAMIYILNKYNNHVGSPVIETLHTKALPNLHVNTFAGYLITGNMRRQEFNLIAQLASHVPVKQLTYGDDIQTVKLQCEAVIADCMVTDKLKTEQ